jgi:hypothetical protein
MKPTASQLTLEIVKLFAHRLGPSVDLQKVFEVCGKLSASMFVGVHGTELTKPQVQVFGLYLAHLFTRHVAVICEREEGVNRDDLIIKFDVYVKDKS